MSCDTPHRKDVFPDRSRGEQEDIQFLLQLIDDKLREPKFCGVEATIVVEFDRWSTSGADRVSEYILGPLAFHLEAHGWKDITGYLVNDDKKIRLWLK